MYLTTKSGKKVYMPSDKEDAAITAAALSDPDAQPLNEADFKKLKRIGRPNATNPKVSVNLRLDEDLLEALRESGSGWQTRVNDELRAAFRLTGRLS